MSRAAQRATQSRQGRRMFFFALFVLGLVIAVYPLISNWYYHQEQQKEALRFETERQALSAEEVAERMALARAYNETLAPARLSDPYTEEQKAGVAAYAKMLELHEMIGYVEIPMIDVNLPVYAGTSDAVLQRGAGHLEGTSLPIGGASTHAVLTAHRGLAKARMFRDLGKLKSGDVFYFHNIAGTLAYEVDQIVTVEPSNFTPVLIQPDEDLMTLLTCTPYMVNSHRLLVRGHRVDYVEPVDEGALEAPKGWNYRAFIPLLVVLILVLVIDATYQYMGVREWTRRRDAAEDAMQDVAGAVQGSADAVQDSADAVKNAADAEQDENEERP